MLPGTTSDLYLPPHGVCPITGRVNNSRANGKLLNDSKQRIRICASTLKGQSLSLYSNELMQLVCPALRDTLSTVERYSAASKA